MLDAPDDRLSPALVAAGRGEYAAAAGLLAATRAAAEWENRDRYVRRLAAFAGSRPEWYEEWRAAAPDDPGLLLVGTQLAVDRAWPSPARAELLREVSPLITAAARADDRDPVPWRIALDHARGSRAGHRYFEELWGGGGPARPRTTTAAILARPALPGRLLAQFAPRVASTSPTGPRRTPRPTPSSRPCPPGPRSAI